MGLKWATRISYSATLQAMAASWALFALAVKLRCLQTVVMLRMIKCSFVLADDRCVFSFTEIAQLSNRPISHRIFIVCFFGTRYIFLNALCGAIVFCLFVHI